MITLRTERLVLRDWTDSDRPAFANLNGDLRVAEFLPSPLSPRESDELFEKIQSHIRAHGFGFYAVELPGEYAFIGYIGLAIPSFEAKFTPCVEIGWRLAAEHWNQGLATEGARAVAHHAFENLGIPELVSFTVPANQPSRRVMEKLGMTRDPAEDFEHPRLPEGHPLRRHVLYRLRREQFSQKALNRGSDPVHSPGILLRELGDGMTLRGFARFGRCVNVFRLWRSELACY